MEPIALGLAELSATECNFLLHELRSAWEQIAPNKNAQNAAAERIAPMQQDALAPRKSSFISV